MAGLQDRIALIDWEDCNLVEVVPGKVSDVPLLKGTRLPAHTILENYDGGSAVDEVAENFDISEQAIRASLLTRGAAKARAPVKVAGGRVCGRYCSIRRANPRG